MDVDDKVRNLLNRAYSDFCDPNTHPADGGPTFRRGMPLPSDPARRAAWFVGWVKDNDDGEGFFAVLAETNG